MKQNKSFCCIIPLFLGLLIFFCTFDTSYMFLSVNHKVTLLHKWQKVDLSGGDIVEMDLIPTFGGMVLGQSQKEN